MHIELRENIKNHVTYENISTTRLWMTLNENRISSSHTNSSHPSSLWKRLRVRLQRFESSGDLNFCRLQAFLLGLPLTCDNDTFKVLQIGEEAYASSRSEQEGLTDCSEITNGINLRQSAKRRYGELSCDTGRLAALPVTDGKLWIAHALQFPRLRTQLALSKLLILPVSGCTSYKTRRHEVIIRALLKSASELIVKYFAITYVSVPIVWMLHKPSDCSSKSWSSVLCDAVLDTLPELKQCILWWLKLSKVVAVVDHWLPNIAV